VQSLRRYALFSVAAAVVTILLKAGAWAATGSVGLLSDALESGVNLAAAAFALGALTVAARPEDEEHAYGHSKAEYFASAFEGALIVIAAVSIGATAMARLRTPRPVEDIALGLTVSALASLVNLAAARVLMTAGRRHDSIALRADAQHLLTDVWTSAAVIVGVGLSSLTRQPWLDAVIALLVAVNIVRVGARLIRSSALGLLDTALPESVRRQISGVLDEFASGEVQFHALRTRRAGRWRFISVHVLVPGEWSVQRGHDLLEQVEERLRGTVPDSTVFTHLEPLEDPVSFQDQTLRRLREGPAGSPARRPTG
jgi:cation diffusion facilitator family transporter